MAFLADPGLLRSSTYLGVSAAALIALRLSLSSFLVLLPNEGHNE